MFSISTVAASLGAFHYRRSLTDVGLRHLGFAIPSIMLLAARAAYLTFHRLPRETLDHSSVQRKFGEMVQLCLSAYEDGRRLQPGDTVLGWEYVGSEADLSLHLWRKAEGEGRHQSTKWALVVKGTSLVQELGVDWRLLLDSTSGSNWFDSDADHIRRQCRELLMRHDVDPHHVITFTGHSLGATYAEILLNSFRHLYPRSEGVTFESPGQPRSFRHRQGMPNPLPSLITLNSTPNPVNTLNSPAAAIGSFYACGTGAGFPLAWLVRPTWWAAHRVADIVLNMLWVVRSNARTHSLRYLEAYIHAYTYQPSDPVTWPLYSGNAFGTVYNSCCLLRGTAPYEIRQTPVHRRRQALVRVDPHPGIAVMPSVPVDANGAMDPMAMDIKTPYKIPTIPGLVQFTNRLNRSDMAITIVGANGDGKSSVFKALLGLDITDTSVPIDAGTNTTPFPVVAYICTVLVRGVPTRIYLLDTPGIGAAGATDANTGFFFNQASDLINIISPFAGTIYYVQRDSAPNDYSVTLYTDLSLAARQANIRIRVIYNTLGTSPTDEARGEASLTLRFTEGVAPVEGQIRRIPNFDPEQLVRCRAITGDTTDGNNLDVTALNDMWNRELEPESIIQAGRFVYVEHRPREPVQVDLQAPILARAAGATTGVAAGAAGMGFLTYLPGVAFWPGPVLGVIEGVTAVCALPVALTGAAACGMGWVGYKGAKRLHRWTRRRGIGQVDG